MRAITEMELRRLYTTRGISSYSVPSGTLVTPAALQFAKDNGIMLKMTDETSVSQRSAGGEKTAKPEEVTHLTGDTMVSKTHPRILLRGKVDSLQAQLLGVIIESCAWGIKGLPADLEAVLKYLRELIKAEVTGMPLSDLVFRGWNMDEIRTRSHHPERYFGIGHLFPAPEHGIAVARLNLLRTLCRETELAGVAAFTEGEAVVRKDLITGLNRLNSLFYVMMIMIISGKYVE
ncbi:MAG: hypothetical protein ACYC21_02300 [Eubacteriales bacterium]